LVAGLRRPVLLVREPAGDREAAVLQPVLLLQPDAGRADQPGGIASRHEPGRGGQPVPDDAGRDPAAGAADGPLQRQLPVRDVEPLHRVPGQPGLPERGLRLLPEADWQLIVYSARRIALAGLVIAGVLVLTFVIARGGPGGPAATWAGPRGAARQGAAGRECVRPGRAAAR